MNRTAQNMQKLISRKYYLDEETAKSYLDLFVMAERITQDEYISLAAQAGEAYVIEN